MRKHGLNVHLVQNKTDAAQNFIDGFFSTLTVRGPFHKKDFSPKKKQKMVDGGTGLISEKKEVL